MTYMKLWLVTPDEPTDDKIESILSKYHVDNEEYFIFYDKTEDHKKEYETEGTKVIWKDNGSWHFIWQNDTNEIVINDQVKIKQNNEDAVYKPWKELYPTLRDFVNLYHKHLLVENGVEMIGYYKNPFGRYDHYSFYSTDSSWSNDLILKDGTETWQAQKKDINIEEMHWRVRQNHEKGWRLSKVAKHAVADKKDQIELAEKGIDAFASCIRHPKLKPYLKLYGNNWPYCFLMNDNFYSKEDMLDIFQYLRGSDINLFDQKMDERKALWNEKMQQLWDSIPEDSWITVIALHY